MAYVGTGTAGKTYIGSGNGQSGTFADIGTNSGLTAHGVVVAEGNSPFTVVSPTATTGVPLVSQGASSDPTFGTCKVAGGGTGTTNLTGVLTGNGTNPFTASTVTEYAVICGDASNKVQSVASVGTAGQVLSSAGAGAIPAWTTATYPATTTANQILYSSAANTVTGLANGTTGQVLTATTGAAPSWAAAAGGSGGFYPYPTYSVASQDFFPVGTGVSTTSTSNRRIYYLPYFFITTQTWTSVVAYVTTNVAGSVGRLGLYSNVGFYPTTLLYDWGTFSLTTTGAKVIAIAQSISAGMYWLAYCVDNNAGAPAVRSVTPLRYPYDTGGGTSITGFYYDTKDPSTGYANTALITSVLGVAQPAAGFRI